VRSPGSLGARVLGTGAGLLILFLLVGFLLSGRWEADQTLVIAASPERIFPLLESPQGWQSWTPWPDSGLVTSGPATGPGARMAWDDPNLGDGAFEIVEAEPPRLVRYRVSVQHNTMRTEGSLRLEPAEGGTRVSWVERGDFGNNPLMGYWALAMHRAQGRELGKSLTRLAELVTDSMAPNPSAPADSGSPRAAPADSGASAAR
jgi:uncharacterized protein YndB with AHSA1/START domain